MDLNHARLPIPPLRLSEPQRLQIEARSSRGRSLEFSADKESTGRAGASSIAGHAGLDFVGPAFNSAGHRLGVGEALLAEPVGNAVAAAALVAVDDDAVALMPGKLADSIGKRAHRHELSAVDLADRSLVRLAAVEEDEFFTRCLHLRNIGDTIHDIRCARAIGALAVAIPTGGSTRDELAAEGPDILLNDLSDSAPLLRVLDEALAA